jgi:hypothetical protein
MNGRPAGTPKVPTEEQVMGLFSRFRARGQTDQRSWFDRLVMPRGRPPDPELERIREAAAADVADMEAEDRKYFDQNSPGNIEDDL